MIEYVLNQTKIYVPSTLDRKVKLLIMAFQSTYLVAKDFRALNNFSQNQNRYRIEKKIYVKRKI
jgi:bifunctional pyridoxal-dependent enzyme with beta-cystathionase and maltose regulon repressor activities